MSNERLNLLISAPEGFEIIGTIPRSYMNDESCLIVRYDIKRTDINTSMAIEPSPHAALIAQCDEDKKQFPDFWWELYQWQYIHAVNKNVWFTCEKDNDLSINDYHHRQHPHRASIIEYHQCSDADKLRWQINVMGEWENITGKSDFGSTVEYRLRPRTCQITINGTVLEYPEPVREPLEDGQEYWIADMHYGISNQTWTNTTTEIRWLSIGIVHPTKQAAQQHLAVLQAVNAQVAV